jgi:hypothetical protein
MEDLNLTINLLSTSSDLEQASMSLKKMSERQKLDIADKDSLSWAGNFLLAMDWGAQMNKGAQVGGNFAVEATSIRPTFYSCLFRIAPQLKKAGINSNTELLSFLSTLYRNLISHGSPGRGGEEA